MCTLGTAAYSRCPYSLVSHDRDAGHVVGPLTKAKDLKFAVDEQPWRCSPPLLGPDETVAWLESWYHNTSKFAIKLAGADFERANPTTSQYNPFV